MQKEMMYSPALERQKLEGEGYHVAELPGYYGNFGWMNVGWCAAYHGSRASATLIIVWKESKN
jgi:hypothetical protein